MSALDWAGFVVLGVVGVAVCVWPDRNLTERGQMMDKKPCDHCAEPAEFELDVEDSQSVTPRACDKHLGKVARAAIDTWGEHGVICVMDAAGS